MGLLATLKLEPPKRAREPAPGMIDVNIPTADPKAVERAMRKARRRGPDQRAVLDAALDMAERPDAISAVDADAYAVEAGNPTPVSKVAPRSMYNAVNARMQPENESYGSVETVLEIQPYVTSASAHGNPTGVDFDAKAIVGQRRIVPSSLGNGETISAAKGVLHKHRGGRMIPPRSSRCSSTSSCASSSRRGWRTRWRNSPTPRSRTRPFPTRR